MKQQVIVILFLVIHFSSWSQKTIKTDIPCSDEVLFKTPGKWFTDYGGMLDNGSEYIPFNKTQVKETVTRMDVVRDMLKKIYPEPMGVDAAWHHTIGRGSFGEQVKYVKHADGWDREALAEKPVASYGFVCGFFRHGCSGQNPNEIWHGYPGETNTWFTVGANGIGAVATEISGGEKNMLINGYPVHLLQPVKEKFDGYELFQVKEDVFPGLVANAWRILFHRKGELPYTPVTREQYLEQALIYLTQFYDEAIRSFQQMPVGSADEQDTKKEQMKNLVKNKDAVLKHYKDELEETAKKSLLKSPAIIPLNIFTATADESIFVEENIGYTVVIENPAYMRKDLPKYVPQILTVKMGWDEEWKPQADVAKLIREKFPFEKLQAMIDK
jgi:hypothetical protein